MRSAMILLLAMGIDVCIGWPHAIYAQIGHPVTWIGAMIAALDRRFNRTEHTRSIRRCLGAVTALAVIGTTAAAALAIVSVLPGGAVDLILTAVLAWPLLAVRSMYDHVEAVARPLRAGDLGAARAAVAMIVGRDPALLDEQGVRRAAIESLAENTSDGIVAPLVWGLVFGLPGLAAYKAINTLDSMLGHRTPRYEAFGWASARIDDIANLIPARLTGVAFAAVSVRPWRALVTMGRDAAQHRSPNGGWPEAAMAGALDIRLSGPRSYAGQMTMEPWINGTAADPGHGDLDRALALYRRTMFSLATALALMAVL